MVQSVDSIVVRVFESVAEAQAGKSKKSREDWLVSQRDMDVARVEFEVGQHWLQVGRK